MDTNIIPPYFLKAVPVVHSPTYSAESLFLYGDLKVYRSVRADER